MHKATFLLAPLMLAACATTTAGGSEPSGACDAGKVQSALGQPFTVELGADVESTSGARASRVIRPGQAVTMDYRLDRLNIELDAADKIVSLRCG